LTATSISPRTIPYERFQLVTVSPLDQKVVVKLANAEGNFGEPMEFQVVPRAQSRIPLSRATSAGLAGRAEARRRGGDCSEKEGASGLSPGFKLIVTTFLCGGRRIAIIRLRELLKEGPAEGKDRVPNLRKPPANALALRRIVYDNNHQAKDLLERKLPPRWAGRKGQAQRRLLKINRSKRDLAGGEPSPLDLRRQIRLSAQRRPRE